jgi:hypothetical protein
MQSARSRSSSGSTTPDGNLSSFRPSARGFQQQPSAELGLVTYALPPPPARQNVNVPLNLEQELEMRQIEILNPNISGARTKTLQNEINALEDQIRASGGTVTSLEDRISSAMNTKLIAQIENIHELTERLTAAETIMNESLNTNTSAERYIAGEITATPKERMKYYRGRNIYTAAKLEKEIVGIELKLLNPTLPQEQRRALVAEQEKLRGEQRAGLEKAQAVEKARAEHIAAKGLELESRLRPTNATAFEIETGIGSVRNMSWVESLRERLGGYRRIPLSEERGALIDPTAPPKKISATSIPRDITDITRQTASESGRIIGPEFSEAHAAGVGFDLGDPRGAANRERIRQFINVEEPTLPPPPPMTVEPPERPSRPMTVERPATEQRPEIEPMGSRPPPAEVAPEMRQPFEVSGMRTPPEEEVIKLTAEVERPVAVATETSVDRFNNFYDRMVEGQIAGGYEVPKAPPGLHGIEKQKHIMDEIIREHQINEREFIGGTNDRVISPEEAFARIQTQYDKALNDPRTQRPVEVITAEEHIGAAVPKGKKGRLTKKTGLLATGEQRPMQTALTGEASRATLRPTEVSSRAAAAAPEARAATMTEARATMRSAPTPETVAARSVLAPETSSRVPTLTAPEPAGPRVRAQVRAIETTERPIAPPTESPAPSAPPSAPETPREATAVVERTPAERAAFSEEVSAGLSKRPGRQKVKQNIGKPKTTVNPLERFVAAQFRNAPNVEIHPGAKSLSGALSELGSRVPRLVPTREILISAGHTAVSEGGGMVAGFFAGSYAGQKMNEYFATHPPKNRGEEFGQALATNMVALAVGNLTSKVVAYVIKQGARVAVGAAVSGSISSAGAGGSTAILEAVVFATVATTTQYFTTKALEDAGYSHEISRSQGSLAATLALMDLEMASFLLKGGPLNLYADAAFIVSELFIIGFGIWSYFEEKKAGAEEDAAEAATKAQREQEIKERNESIARINATNNSRAAFMVALETHDYDFDELYATLDEQQKIELGISTPEGKASFQRQVEAAFFPFGMEQEPAGFQAPPAVLSPIELQRREVFNNYISWYQKELRGENPPPFNFNDPKVVELNEYSGGTWESAARVSATTAHMQSERVHPLIEKAQNEIIEAFHNERKTIDKMPPETVRYALLDPSFRKNYEDYIVADAQAQILLEFNNTQHTYVDMDPELLAIADRDPNFRAAADAYYQVLANQARDLNLPISTVAHLNSLMENEQVIEIGKLNDARNLIISRSMADNQAAIDTYNASIVREINMYGDNFEAIIRNINEQSLLSGHTFLYASTRADLYRQLHMEMPEIEFVDPGDETDPGDATYRPAKGRKVGDTALYNYRHYLTDEQNQELEDMILSGEINRYQEEDQAMIIRERDRYIYEETDQERANSLNMTLPEYYAKFGIPVDPYQMEIVDFHTVTTTPTNGRVRQRDGTIFTYRNGILVNKEKPVINVEPVVSYNPSLVKQPDGRITMPDGSVRTYKDGKVTSVLYPPNTKPAQILTIDQINAQEGIPPYEQLKTMYPQAYQALLKKYAGDPDADAKIEETLARGHKTGYQPQTPNINPDGTIDPETPDPTPVTPPQPVPLVLFTGERKMPDGTTRFYRNGKVAGIDYPAGFPVKNMLDAKGIKALNNSEGIYYDPNPPTIVTPVTPTEPLKNGIVNMPDGSTRTYENGLVVYVKYPGAIKSKTPKEINEEEGIRDASYTAPVAPVTPVTPVAPVVPLQQGVVKMPDGSKRMYIDGKVVSVEYPTGVTGPTLHEINAAEGAKAATPDPVREQRILNVMNIFGYSREQAEQYANLYEINRLSPPDGHESLDPFREPSFEDLQIMYGPGLVGTPHAEQNYRILHADEKANGTAPPLPTGKQILEHRNRETPPVTPVVPGVYIPPPTPVPVTYDREPTYEELVQMYGVTFAGTNNPEQNLRILHADEVANGTAPPLPPLKQAPAQPTQPTQPTNQPLPFVPGAKSYEYTDSGTQANTKPTQPTTTTPSGGGPSDYRPRQAEPIQNNQPTTTTTSLARQAPAQTISPAAIPPS